ncbi:NlpC/P60 family protein [Streptomyces alboflavus]|uniref:C40 family peptidase n=1 Tax=Streptomyces alboflavus TaxID=67267 RepID=UPI000F656BE6|nr:NlpC/P60 family protein [Streptomyces alboflavus]
MSRAGGCAVAAMASVGAFVIGLSIIGGAIQEEDDDKGGELSGGTFIGKLDTRKVPKAYRKWVLKAGRMCEGVSAPLIAAQIEQESGWNPRATSPVGAQGISQFMPGTWRTWGMDADGRGGANVFSPPDAIMTQARYDCFILKKVKSYKVKGDLTRLMLAGYNAGPDAVRQYGGIPPYLETQRYVKLIMSLIPKYSAGGSVEMSGPLGRRIAAQAKKWIGTPYAWGGGGIGGPSKGIAHGAGTVGFDCSGLTQYAVYHGSKGRITLPRSSQAQAGGTAVKGRAQPGDLIAFQLNGGAGNYDHIGVYIGNNRFVHAPRTGSTVKVSSLTEPYYASKVQKIRRMK